MARISRVIKHDDSRPSEKFDPQKLQQSLKSACLSVRCPDGEATKIAELVTHDIVSWIQTKPEVTSADIRHHASRQLEHYSPDAAHLYKHQRMVM